jgi:CRISPR-associated protein Csb1
MNERFRELDGWITNADGPVALHLRQELLPVDSSRIIFPPTYADVGYNLDGLADGTSVVTVDSVASQANRLEPLFRSSSSNPHDWLVPQITIVIRKEDCGACDACRENAAAPETSRRRRRPCQSPREVSRSLLDLAHRGADAVVQATPGLAELIASAFGRLAEGEAGPLAVIAPTSLVFGVWDSRGSSGVKVPRLIRSVVRAWDVEVLHSAAQYNSIWKLLDEEQRDALSQAVKGRQSLSEVGFKDSPAVFRKLSPAASKGIPEYQQGTPNPERRVLGGVRVRGQIVREVTINLVALRGLGARSAEEAMALRRYVFGLALLAAAMDIEPFFREGCLLRYAEGGDRWDQVPRRGATVAWSPDLTAIGEYAAAAAEPFREQWPGVFGEAFPHLRYRFDVAYAKELIKRRQKAEQEEEG